MARICVRMFYILVLCPVLLASAVLTLTIDSQLGTSAEDCFDRISIGEQLPRDAIYRNVTELTTMECEQICKQDKQCQAYDYGVGAKGNATCDLTNMTEKQIKDKNLFIRNPDYDVYVRRFQCEQSPPLPMGQQNGPENENSHRPVIRPGEEDPNRPLYDDLNPYETNRPSYISNRPHRPSYGGDDRPDDYNTGSSDVRPPSYGTHKPQEIPFGPERPPSYGSHKPQEIPHRPDERPPSYGAHKPQEIPFRPESDRPPSYGVHKPQEIPYRPENIPPSYGTHKPQEIPYRPDDRPPSYGLHKPQEIPYRPDDRPPSYGSHKPQEIPYKPENRPPSYGSHRPQEIPYRPDDRPSSYGSQKPQEIPYRPEDRPPSYGSHKPQEIPYRPDDRPPSYGSHKPQEIPYRPDDRPPSYGLHKPQEIPYRPEDRPPSYGANKPQDIPYRPVRPSSNTSRPDDSYDQLYFQVHGKPRPEYWRPDPYHPPLPGDEIEDIYGPKPVRPQFEPDRPQYQYIIRPNRRPPKPLLEDQGYHQVKPLYQSRPEYGTGLYDPDRIYQPTRPYNKPSYTYTGQYASNYGTSQDNSIKVEIYDPPRFYRPRPSQDSLSNGEMYGQGYGYNSYTNQQSISLSAAQYESWMENYHGYKPHRPSSSGYGVNENDDIDYRPIPQKPKPSLVSGSYGQNDQGGYNQGIDSSSGYGQTSSNNGYGGQTSSNSQGYGSGSSTNSEVYGQSGYGGQTSSNNQGYGSVSSSNSEGYGQNGYGGQSSSNTDGYGQSGYGGQSNSNNQGYGSGSSSEGYGQSSYAGQSTSNTEDQSGYGGQTSSSSQGYGQSGYGSQSTSNTQGYGQTSESGSSNAGYGQNSYGSQSSFGGQTQSNQYGSTQSGYGNQISNSPSGYGNQISNSQYDDEGGYRNQASSSYGDKQSNKYGSDSKKDYYNQIDHSYGNKHSDRYDFNQMEYYGSHLGYGIHDLYGIKPGSYGKDPNQYYMPIITNKGPYGENRFNNYYGNENKRSNKSDLNPAGYRDAVRDVKDRKSNKDNASNRADVKPVYENGPGKLDGDLVTSKPVAVSANRRNPKPGESYEACFRRVLAGRRALRSHVRKVVNCERLEDCRRECAEERRFHCESFNYRLDPTFRGKGLCELMTKPIEAFDLQQDFVDDKDYDFYELDRNSLEPYCPETLRGPGLLHSGFLTSKTAKVPGNDNQWRDRTDWSVNGYKSYNRLYDEKRTQIVNRRYEDELYVPYQIGVIKNNDNRRTDENWGQYGGNYGGTHTYYKDRNDYHKSKNHWGITETPSYYHGVKHHNEKEDFNYQSLQKHTGWEDHGYGYGSWKRGRWNSSGSFWKELGEGGFGKKGVHEFEGRSEDGTKEVDCVTMLPITAAIANAVDEYNDDVAEDAVCSESPAASLNSPLTPFVRNIHYAENITEKSPAAPLYSPLTPLVRNIHHAENITENCSSRRRPGMSLGSGAIRRSLLAHTVVECEAACFGEREFKCVSYSYKYSSSPGSDNCFLSERPYRGLEMSADSGSDVYAMPLHQDCETVSTKPWVESECFWHVRSGAAVSGKAVRAAITVSGLGACEAECIRAHSFFCRGFSFRFDPPTIGDDLENCILTSSPPTSLELKHGLTPNKHELYSRGNYGRGCEPALYDDVNREPECYLQYESSAKLTPISIKGSAHAKDERACGHACTDAPFTCLSFSFKSNAPPDSENCLLSEIRLFDLQRGVDYEHSTDDLLFAFDLFNGQCWRKVHGKGEYDVPSFEVPRPLSAPTIEETYSRPVSAPDFPLPPPETYISSSGPTGPDYPSHDHPKPYIIETEYKPSYDTGPAIKPSYLPSGSDITGPSGPPGYPSGSSYKPSYPPGDFEPNRPSYEPYRPSHRPSYKPDYLPSGSSGFKPSETSGSYPSGPNYPSYGPAYPPYYPDKPVYKPSYSPSSSGYKPPSSGSRPAGYPGQDAGYRPQRPPPIDKIDESLSVSWRHYTVSGFPCRTGTVCEQNLIAGHWACEPEGGEIGSWDYCCAETHRCGYSEGFQKPWCYVGPSHEQWRPCSEKYYPYHHHNVPHPSQGRREAIRPRPDQNKKPIEKPNYVPADRDRYTGGYLPEGDRKYWDNLYKNGPQAYYDKNGNPLPGYTRVPIEDRPHIKYQRNPARPGSGYWIPVSSPDDDAPPAAGGLGVPRYWPVAYLHKGPPPNMTYFRFNETTTAERYTTPPPENQPDIKRVNLDKPTGNDIESRSFENSPRAEKRINITSDEEDVHKLKIDTTTLKLPATTLKLTTTTLKPVINETVTEKELFKVNNTENQDDPVIANVEEDDIISGIDGKLHDFTKSIEVYDIEDIKGDKIPDFKTLEAEERQIEAIGRLLASRRGGKLVIHKRSQKDLESKSISLDKDFIDFNFGNKFPTTERRGVIQKVSKEDIEKNKFLNDKSLEVSETTFVRPPRVLSTTENVRKAVVNGKVFYDATIRDQRELYANSTRRAKNLRLEEHRAPSVIPTMSTKKKTNIRTRNTNPVRRVRRVYKKRYNPEEVRKRLLERERNKNATDTIKS